MEKVLSMGRRGQIILAASILIVVGLVMMKNLFSLYTTIEEKRHEDIMLNDKRIDNIRSEYEYIVGIASVQSDANNSGILYLANFSNYIRAETTDVRVFYAFVHVNATSNKFYITAGNFLKDKINITINATYSLPIGVNYAMSDKTNKTWEFGPGVATGNTKTITILYDYKNSQVKETFTVTMNKNFTSGFFDIIIDGDHSIEKKVYYKVTR